jgi:HK97 family phage portal protein
VIIERLVSPVNQAPATPVPAQAHPGQLSPQIYRFGWSRTKSKQVVNEESSKKIATVYRCANTISDDIGMMPLQVFHSLRGNITRVYPDAVLRNIPYLLEKQPNRWMTPFIWKKTLINWLQFWGNAYVWAPVGSYKELFIMPADKTYPVLDKAGNKWYATTWKNEQQDMIPDVEMVHLMINSSDGLNGNSVLTYARETMGRQQAAHETQDALSGNGLNPTAALYMTGEVDQEAREKTRRAYLEAAGSGAAIFDSKVAKYEQITMKPTDAQFLEGIAATDADLANFFNFPLHKLNMGKQSYESNEQQELNYIHSALNPHLVQIEQAGGMKWVAEADQPFVYLKFNRDSILQTDSKTRAEIIRTRIQSGMMTPNQALQIEDQNGYVGGDGHYMPSNMGMVQADGSILGGTATGAPGGNGQ